NPCAHAERRHRARPRQGALARARLVVRETSRGYRSCRCPRANGRSHRGQQVDLGVTNSAQSVFHRKDPIALWPCVTVRFIGLSAQSSYPVNDRTVANENTALERSEERTVSLQRSIYDPGYVNAMSHF